MGVMPSGPSAWAWRWPPWARWPPMSSWRGAVHATVAAAAVAFVLMLLFYRDPPAARSGEHGASHAGARRRGAGARHYRGLGWGVFNASYVVFELRRRLLAGWAGAP